MAKKLTKNQIEFNKQVKRINRAIKTYEKKGFYFQNLPDLSLPARITQKKLNELKSLKPKKLAEKYSVFVITETGEFIPAKQKITLDNELRKQKISESLRDKKRKEEIKSFTSLSDFSDYDTDSYPVFSDLIISNFRAEITNFGKDIQAIIYKWLEEVSTKYGTDLVAEQIENAKQNGLIQILYEDSNEESTKYVLSRMTDALPDFNDNYKAKITQALEKFEDWNDIIED